MFHFHKYHYKILGEQHTDWQGNSESYLLGVTNAEDGVGCPKVKLLNEELVSRDQFLNLNSVLQQLSTLRYDPKL